MRTYRDSENLALNMLIWTGDWCVQISQRQGKQKGLLQSFGPREEVQRLNSRSSHLVSFQSNKTKYSVRHDSL